LCRDNEIVEKILKHLGDDGAGMHGELHVILSCLRRMEPAVKHRIAIEEGCAPSALPETSKPKGQYAAKTKEGAL